MEGAYRRHTVSQPGSSRRPERRAEPMGLDNRSQRWAQAPSSAPHPPSRLGSPDGRQPLSVRPGTARHFLSRSPPGPQWSWRDPSLSLPLSEGWRGGGNPMKMNSQGLSRGLSGSPSTASTQGRTRPSRVPGWAPKRARMTREEESGPGQRLLRRRAWSILKVGRRARHDGRNETATFSRSHSAG